MKRFRHSVTLVIIFVPTLVLIGCAEPPEAEKAAAKLAMDKALSSGAEKYAVDDRDAAKKIWDTAESEMGEKRYEEAKQSYVAAKDAFDIVAGNADERRNIAVTAEANAAVASLEEDWKNLNMAVTNIEKKMKDKETKDAWAADTEAFTIGLKETKDKIFTDPAGAKADAVGLESIIEKWDAAFKELATAPPEHKPTKKIAEVTEKRKNGGKYSIQIRAYPETEKNAAMEFATKLRREQPDVHMEIVYIRGRIWCRILVGHFVTREEASTYMKQKKVFKTYPGSFVQLTSEEQWRPEGDFGHIKPS